MTKLTPPQRARLRAATLCDDRTIVKWWADPTRVKSVSCERLDRAAANLGIAREATPAPARPDTIE